MPDHKPRPWEKQCPKWWMSGPCHDCHGTGYVPMGTSEMLEALRPYEVQLTAYTWNWQVRRTLPDKPGYHYFTGPTPDDALRRALDATE